MASVPQPFNALVTDGSAFTCIWNTELPSARYPIAFYSFAGGRSDDFVPLGDACRQFVNFDSASAAAGRLVPRTKKSGRT